MSGDLPDDYRGLADWLLHGGEPGRPEAGEPAGPAGFGRPPLVPLPRRAPDELF
ncbi:hypothetical protein [Actinosynnema sp. NPDC023587]|uniref:hypothetical protein n=1 Tax=Actinosynnema sp. NPDC023587 TaxID=3154695 RepID=UPI0033EA6180